VLSRWWVTVNEYRCYFFGPETAVHTLERGAANTVHILQLASDDLACQVAEAIRAECEHIRSFEIWQGERCIRRAAALALATA
jgi:hypothetical protein